MNAAAVGAPGLCQQSSSSLLTFPLTLPSQHLHIQCDGTLPAAAKTAYDGFLCIAKMHKQTNAQKRMHMHSNVCSGILRQSPYMLHAPCPGADYHHSVMRVVPNTEHNNDKT